MTSGLDALEAKRKTARSSLIPPSQHAPRAKPVDVAVEAPQAAVEAPKARLAPVAPPEPASEPAAVVDGLVRKTIYFGESEDATLEDLTIAGRRAKPRVEASRSAIVRLALSRLVDQLTPEEIIDELRQRGSQTVGTGRKRLG